MASSRIADLTVNEFKELVRESVVQSIAGLLGDPLTARTAANRLREDFAEALQRSLAEVEAGAPPQERAPNATTIAAMRETEEGHLPSFDSVQALFDDLHADDQANE